ncbi:hypothetical protein J6590_001113 [Homalodisca vitripennis]|nr:hypothetical protein J6590_001113 [Homalodisca vitripennis]
MEVCKDRRAIPKHPSIPWTTFRPAVGRMTVCGVPFNKQANDLYRTPTPSIRWMDGRAHGETLVPEITRNWNFRSIGVLGLSEVRPM